MKNIKAIIYKSKAGHTKRYAELLAEELKLPYYSFDEIPLDINKQTPVIALTYVMANSLSKYKKMIKKYNIQLVIAVGSSPANEETKNSIIINNKINSIPLFYVKGGIDQTKLKGFERFIIKMIAKNITKPILAKHENEITMDEKETLETFINNKDYVCVENLKEVIKWYNNEI